MSVLGPASLGITISDSNAASLAALNDGTFNMPPGNDLLRAVYYSYGPLSQVGSISDTHIFLRESAQVRAGLYDYPSSTLGTTTIRRYACIGMIPRP